MSKWDSDDIFSKWFGHIRDNQDVRYTHADRPEVVLELALLFKKAGIEYVEAKMFNKRVIDTLTTEEGRKDKGRYKGWKQAVEEDFMAALAQIYVDKVSEDERSELLGNKITHNPHHESINSGDYIPRDSFIEEWCKNNFKHNLTEALIAEAHRINSILNITFMKETFDKELK